MTDTHPPCPICTGDQDRRVAVDRGLASGRGPQRIERELRGLWPISSPSVIKHREHWLLAMNATDRDVHQRILASQTSRTDIAVLIRDDVRDRIADGELQPGIGHGLQAQAQLDRREERQQDRELARGLAAMLYGGGATTPPKHITDGSYAHLPIEAGDQRALRGRVPTPRPAPSGTGRSTPAPTGPE